MSIPFGENAIFLRKRLQAVLLLLRLPRRRRRFEVRDGNRRRELLRSAERSCGAPWYPHAEALPVRRRGFTQACFAPPHARAGPGTLPRKSTEHRGRSGPPIRFAAWTHTGNRRRFRARLCGKIRA